MRRLVLVGIASLATLPILLATASAQNRHERPLVLRVKPRSFLDPGTVVPVGTLNRYATQGEISYLTSPPWIGQKERFGVGVLPDPIGGPFIGARNPFPPLPPIESTGSVR
ncbi:hypothetical protein [Microvirga flavescens]|uniref:hypothetical protein n=1 Tax=Microvirga flavescens TaxID=2249811 RepID=UPI000DD7FBE1|nr:hypothetical protein [Microvirga flavescens]